MSSSRDIADVVELLTRRAEEHSSKLALRYLVTGDLDGGMIEWSYAEIERRARFVAARLVEVAKPGDRALLLFAPGLDFVAAFFGCLFAGLIAVPAYPPDPSRLPQTLPRMQAIVADAGASVVLTTSDVMGMAGALGQIAPDLVALRWVAVDDIADDFIATFQPHRPAPDDIAFLQYTSGSTGEPKGVMVTHANIIENERMMQAAGAITPEDHGMGWVPLFHDLGLIANVLQTLWARISTTLMSPIAFLKQPMRWLRVMSHYHGTISGGPDFAYDLCARKVTPQDLETLDLRHWRIAFSSGEPVRAATMERFRKTFAPARFDPRSFFPGLGLAEATLIVTGTPLSTLAPIRHFDPVEMGRGKAVLAEGPRAQAHVSSGRPIAPIRLAIVDPERCTRLSDGFVGEIWLHGPSIARGYWGRPELSAEVFGSRIHGESQGDWLRTGDLGFILDGELYVTGRRKDMIIVRGQNHYPQDIERTAELAARVLRPGCSAAFSIERDGVEVVVLCAEADAPPDVLHEAISAIEAAVLDGHQLVLDDIILLRPRTLRKTSSGKIQRHANKAAYLAGEHDVLVSLRGLRSAKPNIDSASAALPVESTSANIAEVQAILIKALQAASAGSLRDLSLDASLTSLGLDSLKVAAVAGDLEKSLGFEIPVELFYSETIGGVARLIAERRDKQGVFATIDWRAETSLPETLVPKCMHEPSTGPLLLTGATGFLGAALLDELLTRTDRQIICLVRATDESAGLARIRDALHKIGRLDDRIEGRVTAVIGDLAQPRLGLTESVFFDLAQRIGAIYHCGAVVHWTEPYMAIRSANVHAVHEVLALAAPRNVAIHHVSSLGVYPFTNLDRPFFSEEGELDGIEHLRLGYFQSKWVADTLLSAARRRGFTVSIYRPGLVTGDSRTGIETSVGARILGAFVAGCIRMGTAPHVDKVIDVVPVDYVASAIAAISLRPEGLGRSYNLINPRPMRQLELYAALRDMGYPLRELPYPVWQQAVLSLPQFDPDNPLARFALYYRTMTEERMQIMERRMATRLPVDDRNTRALLPATVSCPPFDAQLLATYVKYEQATSTIPFPSRAMAERSSAPAYHLVDRYDHEDERISKLYTRGKDRQWDAALRLDWKHELDPDNPEMLPDTSLPIYGSSMWQGMDAAAKARVRRHFQTWQLSQTLHGEQGALLCASKLVQQAPTIEARLFAATQVVDEARHVELFNRLVQEKIGQIHPMTSSLRKLLDDVLSDARWDMTFLGMQVLVEGLGLAAFSLSRDQSKDPLVSAAYAYVVEDEARHVAFGRLALKDYYPQLSEKERDEREQFVVESAYLLRDRLQGDEIWSDLGLNTAEVLAHVRHSSFQRNYRRELFSRIVPLIRVIGLWGPRVQAAFGEMGVLGFAQVDLDALAAEDERRARTFDKRSS